jgi:hypothetical protein
MYQLEWMLQKFKLADGDQSNITLDINGPASFTAANLTDGSLTFTNVKAVDVDGFEGAFTINSGVETFLQIA